MDRPGFTLPKVSYLRQLPYLAAAGSCLATDPRGTGTYVYGVGPTGAAVPNQGWFGRYAVGRETAPGMETWQILTPPAWTATETIDSGTCMIVDATDGRVWLVTADNAAGPIFHRLRSYDPATDAWTAYAPGAPNDLNTVLALAAIITRASLAHPCTTVQPLVASENFIYLAVANSVILARYDKLNNVWAAANAGLARAAPPAAGSTLDFLSGRPDNLYSLRGGATALEDVYTISTQAWAAGAAVLPAGETFDEGVEAVASPYAPTELLVHRRDNVYRIDLARNVLPVASVAGSDGTQHAGHGVVSYRVGSKWFVGVRLHSKTDFERIEPII